MEKELEKYISLAKQKAQGKGPLGWSTYAFNSPIGEIVIFVTPKQGRNSQMQTYQARIELNGKLISKTKLTNMLKQ